MSSRKFLEAELTTTPLSAMLFKAPNLTSTSPSSNNPLNACSMKGGMSSSPPRWFVKMPPRLSAAAFRTSGELSDIKNLANFSNSSFSLSKQRDRKIKDS